ncbi:TonB-dependent receptor [Rhizorhabdus phycosphaerae]|uniref:TonB-dependent receptor n=1 Tax=Rhizorhabdus phycosphaerae TaxID=2711156 RepID=UPI0013EAEFF4|nr:TonB-dependent receptor [Rhizorhabdus phycosphaerae]
MSRLSNRALFLSAAALIICSPAWAQQASGSEGAGTEANLGEIVVTARQRSERLIDVPVAVTALSAKDIGRYNATTLQDIAQMAPQVTIAKQASGSGSSFVIRGIGSSTLDSGFDQSVAINVDGVQNSRGRSLQQSFFDIGQVEILKGPQALFFGKNSPAGVIAITSANPTREFSAGARIGYDFVANGVQGEAYVSGPITPTLGIRVAVTGDRSRGWMKNSAAQLNGDVEPASGLPLRAADAWGPKERDIMGRLTLAWDPSSSFSANFKFATGISKDNGEGTNGEIVFCGASTKVVDGSSGQTDPYSDCKKNRTVSAANLPPELVVGMLNGNDGKSFSRYKPIISSLTTNWTADRFKLTSVTGYYRYRLDYFQSNFAKTIYGGNMGSQRETYKQFTQELRLLTTFESPLNFMFGAYYEDSKLDNEQAFRIANLPPDAVSGFYYSIGKIGTIDSKTYSAFGQATYKILPDLELAAGIRWSRDEKSVEQQNIYVATLLQAAFPVGVNFPGRYKSNNWSPEATLTWHPTSQTTLYAAFKTGYKAGGFGVPAILSAGTQPSDYSFKPEKVKGGEIGAKGQFLGGRLTLNSAAYLYDYKGLQVDIFDGTKITYQIFNAGAARSYGAEVDARYAVTSDLAVRVALGYNHTRYTDYLSACYGGQTVAQGCNLQPDATGAFTRQDLSGAPTVRAPDWSGSVGVTYDHELGNAMRLGLSSDLVGTSKYYFSETEGPGTLQKGFFKLNAAVRLYRDDERWSLALIAKNIFDKYVVTGGSDRPGSGSGSGTANGVPADIIGYIDRPREVMVQLGFKF